VSKINQNAPVRAFVLIYLVLLIIGYVALMLPGIATRPLTNVEALFTTVSAVTLTGLQACDFVGIFTVQGQFIVLALIQLGAIATVSFSLYFGWLLGRGHLFMDDRLEDKEIKPIQVYLCLLKKTALYFLFFELACSGILYAFWNGDIAFTPSQKLQYALFHGVSVFCHSGFSNLEGNFTNPHVAHSYMLLLALTGVIVLGSIGYAAMFDLISIKRLRERMADPDKNWTLQTRIAIYSTIILVGVGSILWFMSEQHHALKDQKLVESAFTTLFNVAGARSAGFYSVNVSNLGFLVSAIYMVLMFVGVSTSAPGGGLKTSIFYAAIFSPTNVSRTNMRLLGLFIVSVLLMSLIFLSGSDAAFSQRSLKFETLSAFTNSGLSYGITVSLSSFGKYFLMADMVLGRVGLPVLIYILLRKRPEMGQEILMS
jgi:trk system potassium uptake protein TrkH